MIPTLLKDTLPRQLMYAINGARLARELKSVEGLEEMGLFYLFTSGVQVDHYDPIVSRAHEYPVLALDNGLPQLTSSALERLRMKTGRHSKAAWGIGGGEWFSMRLRGAARAQAQLMGCSVTELEQNKTAGGELELCKVSIMVFPVKARMRKRVTRLILETAVQPVRNWLSAAPDRKETQPPLVILFDEQRGTVSTKFCEEWSDPAAPRHYK